MRFKQRYHVKLLGSLLKRVPLFFFPLLFLLLTDPSTNIRTGALQQPQTVKPHDRAEDGRDVKTLSTTATGIQLPDIFCKRT